MAIYSGEVSHKNGLGRVRLVTATDNSALAIAFGVEGVMGGSYTNGKIGMLQLDGELSRNEVAIDPSEMTRSSDIDFARANVGRVIDFSALANALSGENRSEFISQTQRVSRQANFLTMSDEGRAEIVKLVLGIGDLQRAKQVIGQTDNLVALTDTVRRNAVTVSFTSSDEAGGVAFTVSARGTTSVLVDPSAKLIKVLINVRGTVLGSASNAGAKYKPSFVAIKKAVTSLSETARIDRQVRFNPDDDIAGIAMDVRAKLVTSARETVTRSVRDIKAQFADVENFNPASVKTRLWNDLGLTTSDVPQTKLSEEPLRQYDNNELSAIEFANMPENGLVPKVVKAVVSRIENADTDALAVSLVDELAPTQSGDDRESLIASVVQLLETTNASIIDDVESTTTFDTAYDMYARQNSEWVKIIVDRVKPAVITLIENSQLLFPAETVRHYLADELYDDAFALLDSENTELSEKAWKANSSVATQLTNQLVYQTVGNLLTDEVIARVAKSANVTGTLSTLPIRSIFSFKLNQAFHDNANQFEEIIQDGDCDTSDLVDIGGILTITKNVRESAIDKIMIAEDLPTTSGYRGVTETRVLLASDALVSQVVAQVANAPINPDVSRHDLSLQVAQDEITADKIVVSALNDASRQDKYHAYAVEDVTALLNDISPRETWAPILEQARIPDNRLFQVIKSNSAEDLLTNELSSYVVVRPDNEMRIHLRNALVENAMIMVEDSLTAWRDDVASLGEIVNKVVDTQLDESLDEFLAYAQHRDLDGALVAKEYVESFYNNAFTSENVSAIVGSRATTDRELYTSELASALQSQHPFNKLSQGTWVSLIKANTETVKLSEFASALDDPTEFVNEHMPDWVESGN